MSYKPRPGHIRARMHRGAALVVGEQVGSYRVISHLVGNTYRAVHLRWPRRALIELAPLGDWRELAIAMMRSQQLVESLHHPGIARIAERGVLDDGRPWTATDVPSGIGLYDLIARRTLPAIEAATLIRDIADVLAHAHQRGVVHGALTLRSIVLATGERSFPIAVADWGLRVDGLGVYGAPERSMGVIDAKSDVYALGVIAFRAVTRRFPGEGGVYDVPDVPTGLATLIARMLAIDPSERPTGYEVRTLARELLAEPPGYDVVHTSGPRFSKPKWTPSPDGPITSERAPTAEGVIDGEIDKERGRRQRS